MIAAKFDFVLILFNYAVDLSLQMNPNFFDRRETSYWLSDLDLPWFVSLFSHSDFEGYFFIVTKQPYYENTALGLGTVVDKNISALWVFEVYLGK